ncbi:hypothetical protein [Vagococcus fluvialis]|uniref:hypothetical protein n=1 Tax=Vagococcus fluvialis TaxID=2738 RepID=UPI002B31D0B0|nr:hypothetical protein QDW48_06385 [Vagococcus fluvialis]
MEKEILTKIPEGERLISEVVWENIDRYRSEKRITVSTLCLKVGYQTSEYIKNKKSGKQIRLNTIQKFAWALGVKTLDLFEDWSEQ